MANPTPRTDALRAMREAKFEAEQRRMKQEAGKPAATPAPAAAKKPVVEVHAQEAMQDLLQDAVTEPEASVSKPVKAKASKIAAPKKAAETEAAKAKPAKAKPSKAKPAEKPAKQD